MFVDFVHITNNNRWDSGVCTHRYVSSSSGNRSSIECSFDHSGKKRIEKYLYYEANDKDNCRYTGRTIWRSFYQIDFETFMLPVTYTYDKIDECHGCEQ